MGEGWWARVDRERGGYYIEGGGEYGRRGSWQMKLTSKHRILPESEDFQLDFGVSFKFLKNSAT